MDEETKQALENAIRTAALSLIEGCEGSGAKLHNLEYLAGHLGSLNRLSVTLGLGNLADVLARALEAADD